MMERQEAPPPPPPQRVSLPLLLPQNPPYLVADSSLHPPRIDDHQVFTDINDLASLASGSNSAGINGGSAINGDDASHEAPLVMFEYGTATEGITGRRLEKRSKVATSSRTQKAASPRFEFQTRSEDDVLDDGYRWRKYGQKAVKNSTHPRSYYRCVHTTCDVKKQVQRLSEDTSIVVTTYEGVHNHPSEKIMETLSPLLRQIQLLSRFSPDKQ
ncbi:probable WRKY transcription factor 24 [Syzygium oleosum]|uniref:probable WRKY transcription factor 24 n=1 Tax=Syzygium oleosum TaxID=219896 RepID=UPI0024BB1FD8|nr:probable WRKY transcription factor 24 [Syzygium oleosum]